MRTIVLCLFAVFSLHLGAAQEAVTIRWMTSGVGAEYDFSVGLAERYMAANPHTIGGSSVNVTVETIRGPTSATDRLGLYLQYFEVQSSEVDVFNIDVIWPGDLAEHLVDFYAYDGVREDMAAFFPSIVENNTVDGHLVGLPWYTAGGLLYYRADLLEKYGFSGPPQTWEELGEMARVIQEGERAEGQADFWGYVWQGNAYEGLTCNALEWIASSDGGTFISPEGEVTVNNDRAIAALELAASWVGTISPPGITGFQEEDARNAFQAGNAAFQRNWPYAYVLANAPDSVVRDRFGIAPLPGMEAGRSASTLGGWQIAVSAYSGQPEAAVHFARYVTGYEEQLNYALETSNLPTIASVYEDERLLSSEVAWLAELLPVFQAAVARPSTVTAPTYGEASRLIFSTVHDVLLGTTDASTALALLEDDLQALTGLPTGTP